MIAFRVNTFVFNLTSAIYLWIDFLENIYQYGKCEAISTDIEYQYLAEFNGKGYIVYKIFTALPLCFLSSFLCCSLSFKAAVNLIDIRLTRNNSEKQTKLREKNKDSFCCQLFDIDDEDEIIYSEHDFNYVYKLLNNKPRLVIDKKVLVANKKLKLDVNSKQSFKRWNVFAFKCKLLLRFFIDVMKNFIEKYIYDWDSEFRFSSRVLNVIVVAFLALYYFFLYWLFSVIKYLVKLPNNFPEGVHLIDYLCKFYEGLCFLNKEEIFVNASSCIENILEDTRRNKNSSYDKSGFQTGVYASVIIPAIVSFLVCGLQLFLLFKDCRKHLTELYKGQCDFVKKSKFFPNGKIAGGSFHFGG